MPIMFAAGTEPNVRESDENERLSPIAKTSPAGTANGYVMEAACGSVAPWAWGVWSSRPLTNTRPPRRSMMSPPMPMTRSRKGSSMESAG